MSPRLSDLLDESLLPDLIAQHYLNVRTSPCGRYTLLGYTDKCVYDRRWTRETLQCRGLVVRSDTREVVCWPFEKFFNLGEIHETTPEALAARPGRFSVTDKFDGSLINIWWGGAQWHVTSRGSFESSQAQAAERWLTEHCTWFRAGWNHIPYTLMCEWVAPDNRVVIAYDQPDLVLIGARHMGGLGSGNRGDASNYELRDLASELGLRCPQAQTARIEALAQQATHTTGIEGWVLRWPDGFRVKVKTAEYVALHRLITQYSPKRVWEAYCEGKHHDYVAQLPDELQAEARAVVAQIDTTLAARTRDLDARYLALCARTTDRKSFALAVQGEPVEDRPLLFALRDDKPTVPLLLKQIGATL